MKKAITSLVVSAIVGFPLCACAAEADAGIELAFMPSTMDVMLLNEKGKFVAIDMKKIAKGEKCRMDKDAVIMKVGPGETAGAIRVRYAAPQFSSGGCPFLTEFELPEADYTTARAAFAAKKDEASKKVGAGEGNRTLVCSLGSCRSTIELRPRGPWICHVSGSCANGEGGPMDSSRDESFAPA